MPSIRDADIPNLKVGQIIYECESGYNIEIRVTSVPVETVGYERRRAWAWTGVNTQNDETIKFLLTEGLSHYGPRLYTDPEYCHIIDGKPTYPLFKPDYPESPSVTTSENPGTQQFEVPDWLSPVVAQAWNCDTWPKWLHTAVAGANEIADRLDMSTEQALAYAILAYQANPALSDLSTQPTHTNPVATPATLNVKPLEWGEYRSWGGTTKLLAFDPFGNEFARLDNALRHTAAEIEKFKARHQARYEHLLMQPDQANSDPVVGWLDTKTGALIRGDERPSTDDATARYTPLRVSLKESFQQRVLPWLIACFGKEIANDKLERGDRMLEEVFELLQSGDYPRERVLALRDYVWRGNPGNPRQEAGGVMLTVAAYCLAHGINMHLAGDAELVRVWEKIDVIRAKQAAKPVGSALPIPTEDNNGA